MPSAETEPGRIEEGSPAGTVERTLSGALELHRQGRLAEAERTYRAVLRERPDQIDALHLVGAVRLQRGDHRAALDLLDRALAVRADWPEALNNRGLALHGLERYEEAVASYARALAVRSDYAQALSNRAAALISLDRHADALADLDRVLALRPGYVDAMVNRGAALRSLRRHEEALAALEPALAREPSHAPAWNNHGCALRSLARHEEALASFARALAVEPRNAKIIANRGITLQLLDRIDEAIACYDRALELDPADAEIIGNRGLALHDRHRFEESLAHYARAQAIDPGYAAAHWNEALTRLALGDFERGWPKYEWRWDQPESPTARPQFDRPPWLGEDDVAGKRIFLYAEQGLGDTIQFARYAPIVARRGARVTLGVPEALKSLMASLEGVAHIVGSGETLPEFDVHCPLLSLPLACRTRLDSIPASIPYLSAPADRIALWRQRLPPARALRVGLVWRGRSTYRNDRRRSIAFDRLRPLFSTPGVAFTSLQKDVRRDESEHLAACATGDWGEELRDFGDTAAAVSLLDLVIAVDTSVAHLAGALGKPVWILLPYSADWRWLLEREDSPWYPSARLFRQAVAGDWDHVIGRAARELAPLAAAAA